MNIAIIVCNGIDVWDLAFPYKAFSSLQNVNLTVATNTEDGEIVCKDKNLVLGGFESIDILKDIDILWLCQSESYIEKLNKDKAFKSRIVSLASLAKKVICVGASASFLMDGFIDKGKSIATHPTYQRRTKKAKLNYVSDVILNNENIISMSARIGVIFAIKEIFDEFFSEDEFSAFLGQFNLTNFDFSSDTIDSKKRIKDLKKLFKQTLKLEADKNILQLKVDSIQDSFAFYVQDNFDFLSFAVIYSMLSNIPSKTKYIVADRKDNFYVEGADFYVKSTHALHQVKRVNTLVLTGGKIIEERLSDRFLKHWISEIVPRTARIIALDYADRLLGVSGVLVDYDPILELERTEKAKIDGKFVFLENAYELMIYLHNNLLVLCDEKQADILKSEYFL